MSRINVGRVVIGGLAAGVVANILDMVINGYLMVEEGEMMAQRLGLDPNALAGSMPYWIGIDLLYGLLIVFAYAAMRPRFGPGPKTAMIAGATLFAAITIVLAGFMKMGVFTEAAFLKNTALSLVATLAASLAGAWLYKETP